MATLPSGTITFLLTDVEGSTALWERQPETMGAVIARHDALLSEVVTRHGGVVVKSRGEGDSLFAVFARASDAVAAALDGQRSLTPPSAARGEAPGEGFALRVRMAVHTGEAELREGDYYGATINRCARLRAITHGGQVLLSQATRDLVQDTLVQDMTLRDLGEHRLRDLARTEHIYQLCAPDLPAEFPPLRSLDALPNNLPVQVTSFVGRGREMAEVSRLLAGTRLLTLIGAGGAGKTRLALQVAADVLDNYGDGVWLVELAPLADPALVPQAVATVLGVREESGRPLTAVLADALKDRRALLLVDNCEHLIVACATLVDTLIRAGPALHVLATSREALGIAGETVYRVPSLALPPAEAGEPAGSASLSRPYPPTPIPQSEAERLFVDRAQAAQPAFTLTMESAPVVAQICRRLDGMPLALELAAARVPVLTVEQIAARLDGRFRLLTGGSRTALPRQQTLQATIDWSYDLLSEPERVILQRLAVFAGGATLSAVEAVCGGDGIEPDEVLDLLTHLSDKSLITVEQDAPEARYRLLETIRAYAWQRLIASGDVATVQRRHAGFFLARAEDAEPWLVRGERAMWIARLEADHDNLRAALAWSHGNGGDAALGLRLAGALFWFWRFRNFWAEGRRWLESALALPDANRDAEAWAKALFSAGALAFMQGDSEGSRPWLEQSLAVAQGIADWRLMGYCRHFLAVGALERGDTAAARFQNAEAVRLLRDAGDPFGLALALFILGDLSAVADRPAARTRYEESLALFREMGDFWGMALPLTSLGRLALQDGDYETARSLYEEGLAMRRQEGEKWMLAISLISFGEVVHSQGDYQRAADLYAEGLALSRDLRRSHHISWSLKNLGYIAIHDSDADRAAAALRESLALEQTLGNRQEVALRLIGLAGVGVITGRPTVAARLLAAVTRLFAELDVSMESVDSREHERFVAAARAALGEPAFTAAWEAGWAMTLDDAIALAMEQSASVGGSASATAGAGYQLSAR
jgi:predicted ATPase/class 3 adenylate cyclase